MPLKAFLDPTTLDEIPLDKAAAHFEASGIMPAEAVRMILGDEASHTAPSDTISVSRCDPGTVCRRELVLARKYPYVMDPTRSWEAKEGTLWHAAFEHLTAGPGWLHEQWFPDQSGAHDAVPGVVVNEKGERRYELWPGVFLRGIVDRLSTDFVELIDHKTKRFSKKDYGASDEWRVKLSVYARLVGAMTGTRPSKLVIWRMYRGSYEANLTWRKFTVPPLSDGEFAKVGEFAASAVEMLQKAQHLEGDELDKFCATLPMDGEVKRMFNSTKCQKYCGMKDKCYELEGREAF